jgi:hypothetical protein
MITGLSFGLALVNVSVMFALSRGLRWGWLGSIAAQVLWLPYDILTRQYGFILLGAAVIVADVQGWERAGRK